VFVFSVGGGDAAKRRCESRRGAAAGPQRGAAIVGVVGRDGGYAQVADASVLVPTVNDATVTPHAEAFRRGVAPARVASEASGRDQVSRLAAVMDAARSAGLR
jgi:hypothetical protein